MMGIMGSCVWVSTVIHEGGGCNSRLLSVKSLNRKAVKSSCCQYVKTSGSDIVESSNRPIANVIEFTISRFDT